MKKISCDVIRDLLPLYCDDVCSQDSHGLVENHLKDCRECSELLEKMKIECRISSEQEQSHEIIVKDMASVWRKSVMKSFLKGILVTLCACLILAGTYWCLTRLVTIAIPGADVEATVESVADEHVEIHLEVTDGKKVPFGSTVFTEDGKCYILVKRGVIAEKNGAGENWVANYTIPRVGVTEQGNKVEVTEIYYGTADENLLIWQVP